MGRGFQRILWASTAVLMGACLQTENSVSRDSNLFAKDPLVTPTADPAAARFALARQVIRKNCLECHGDQDFASYADESQFLKPTKHGGALVKPGLPDQSRLFLKLARSGGSGNMPLNLPPLPPDDVAKIENWIAQMTWPSDAPPRAPQPSPSAPPPRGPEPSAAEARFSAALVVIQKNCKECHADDDFASYATENQFLKAATSMGPLLTPGNLEKSALYKKLSGTEFPGGDMPQGYAPLSKDDLQALKDWILNLEIPKNET